MHRVFALPLVCLVLLPGAGFAQDTTNGHRVRDFPGSLVSHTIGLASRDNLVPLFVGAGLVLAARPLDDNAQSVLNGEANSVGDVGNVLGEHVILAGVGGLFVAGQLTPAGRFRDVTFDMAQGLVLDVGVTTVMKRVVGRQRPDSSNFRSFPSGHSSASFAMATILYRHLGPRVGIPSMLVAAFVAVSRIESNKHFLTDVVAGGALGYVVGRTVTAPGHHAARGTSGRLSATPFPVDGGAGLYLQLRF